MANTKFVRAVKKAKGLYKSGRYKTFADAVKAAHKSLGSPSLRAKRSKPAKTKVRVTVGATKKKKGPSHRQQLEKSLGASYVRFYKATTIPATNKERKTMATIKKKLRKL